MSTWTDVKNQILQKLPDAGINVISPKRLRESLYAIIDQTIASTPDPVEFEWKATDGLGNSVTYNIGDPVIDDNRWFIAIAENTNKKPVLPDGSINVDFWQEENASTTRYIDIWEAKLYTYPVEIVLHNKKLYLLDRDVVGAAPFLSSDIVAEIAAEPSKWFNLTEASGGSSVTIEQTRSQSTTAVPSSKLLDDELNAISINPTVVANTNLGATPVIDLSTGDVIKKTMNTDVTELSFSNGVEGKAYELHITVDATGGYTFNYTTANIITLGDSSSKLKLVTDANFLNKIIVQKIGEQYLVYPAIDKLLQLNDFLATYAGKANDVLTVKSTGDGVDSKPSINLDLSTIGINSFLELEDTPNSYVGQAGTIPVVKATEDGIENRNTVEINFNDAGLGSVTADTIFEITIGGSTYQLNAKKI